ncbi:transcriptional regulator [Bariatricus massiliensis]|nr:transcriptional regulator [Bariatricus massiliensis]MDY2662816.1 transcriptional regulator [Bariatricus massiliensis]
MITVDGKERSDLMYRVLRGEMVKADITIHELALKIGITERSLRNKINGATAFTWNEVLVIRKIVSPNMQLEELFKAA